MIEQVLYQTRLFQVLKRTQSNSFEVDGKSIEKELTFELVRRPPGVRALIVSDDRILLNREYRFELNDWDYRLPGGKVFDDSESYQKALENNTLREAVENQIVNEVREEADILAEGFKLLKKSTNGLTVEWDLYFFIVNQFHTLKTFYAHKKQKSEYEYIEHVWLSYEEALEMCVEGKISEDRSASVLMRFLLRALNDRPKPEVGT